MVEAKQEIKLELIYPPSVATERALPSNSNYSKNKNKLIYCVQSLVVIREINDPTKAKLCYHHRNKTTCAKFSNAGDWVCSGDEKGNIIIWEVGVDTFPIRKQYETQLSGAIKDIAWTLDDKRIVICGQGAQSFAKVFMWDSGSNVGQITGFGKTVTTADFRPVKPVTLALGGEEFQINFFTGPPYKYVTAQKQHTNVINCLRYSPDGANIISVSSDKKMLQYNGENCTFIKELCQNNPSLHTGGISGIDFFPQNNSLNTTVFATSSYDKTNKIWDLNNEKLLYNLSPIDNAQINDQQVSVQTSVDSVFSFSLNGNLNIWRNIFQKQQSESLLLPDEIYPGHQSPITSLAYSKSQNYLFSGEQNGKILAWENLVAKQCIGKPHQNAINSIQLSLDEQILYSLCRGGLLKTMNTKTLTFEKEVQFQQQVISFKASPISANTVYVLFNNKIQIVQDLNIVREINTKLQNNSQITVSSDSQYLAVGTDNGIVQIIQESTGQLLAELQNGQSKITNLAFSTDNTKLATGDVNHYIKLWDHATNKSLTERMVYHQSQITSLQFSNSGQYLLSTSQDNTIIMWDVKEFARIQQIQNAHYLGVICSCFDSEGSIYSGGNDSVIKKWRNPYV